MSGTLTVAPDSGSAHHRTVSQSALGNDDYEEWRDLMEALEERDREWWDAQDDENEDA